MLFRSSWEPGTSQRSLTPRPKLESSPPSEPKLGRAPGGPAQEPGQDDLPRCLGDGGASRGVGEGVDLYLRLARVPSSEFPCLWAGDGKSTDLSVLPRTAHPLALLYICASDLGW